MRNSYWKLWCLLLAGITIEAGAQTITAVSDPFTFPSITATKMVKSVLRTNPYFTYSNMPSRLEGVRFAWSFPSQSLRQKGSIAIYSPSGRRLKAFSISGNEGSIAWGTDREMGMGIYIAKITCGAASQGLTFLICR